MDVVVKNNSWVFDLSPFVFHVRNLNFQWLTNWWAILGLVAIFGGGLWVATFVLKDTRAREGAYTFLLYAFLIFCTLFGLHKFHVNWGLRWYSTMYLMAFVLFYLLGLYWIKRKSFNIQEHQLVQLIAFLIVGMLIGARLFYVFIYNWDHYRGSPLQLFATWEGGLSFHGGIVGIMAAVWLFCRKNRLPFFHVTDRLAFFTPIGIGLGRIGNFMNGELWGRPVESPIPWAVIFPEGGFIPRHPSQLYQSLMEGWLLFVLLFCISRFRLREGVLSSSFLMLYALMRFPIEYFREADSQVSYFYINHMTWAPLRAYPDTAWWQVLTMGQILCLGCFLCGVLLWFVTKPRQETLSHGF